MPWQYRVFHDVTEEQNYIEDDIAVDLYYIGEAYFNKDGKCDGFSKSDDIALYASSFEDLKWVVEKFNEALQKPVIECDKFEEARLV